MLGKFLRWRDSRREGPPDDCSWVVVAADSTALFDRTLDRGMKVIDRFEGLGGRGAAVIECPGDRLGFLPKLVDDYGVVTILRDVNGARTFAKKMTRPEG